MPFISEESAPPPYVGILKTDLAAEHWREAQIQADRIGLAVVLALLFLVIMCARMVWLRRVKIITKADAAAVSAAATGVRSWREIRNKAQKFAARATDEANRHPK